MAARFDVVVGLRFGIAPYSMGRHEVEIRLTRASLQLSSNNGRLAGARYGDAPHRVPGVRPLAGGIWLIEDPAGGAELPDRAIANEVLCQIETPEGLPAHVHAQLTAAPHDFCCKFVSPGQWDYRKRLKR